MTQVQMDAVRKLEDKKQKDGAVSKYATAVYDSVRDTLIGFCEQNAEFADAVLQQERTLGECCGTIMQKCGNAISDVEVYARAVNFYFPGAKVEMKMTVYMSEFEREEKVPHGEWGEWLRENVSYSVSNAGNMMRLYQEQQSMAQLDMFGNNDFSVFEGMSPSQVLALLPVPRAQRAKFIEESGAKEMSVREIKEAVKAREAAEKRAEEAQARAADAEKREREAQSRSEDLSARLESAETQIKLMEGFPARVPDEEIRRIEREAAEKAGAQAQKKIDAAKKKAEKELEKARAEGAEAVKKVEAEKQAAIKQAEEQARGQAEQEAAAKIAALERELGAVRVSASPYLLRFKERMEAFQSAYAAMLAVVEEAEQNEPETGAQLRAALSQIASALSGG